MIAGVGTRPFPLSVRKVSYGLTCVTAVLALLVVVSSILVVRYQRQISEASQYNVTFDYSQTAAEILRLQVALKDVIAGADPAQIKLRHDILVNRLGIIRDNAFATRHQLTETGDRLADVLRRLEPLLADPADTANLEAAYELLGPLTTPILRLASRAHGEAGDIVLGNQTTLRQIMAIVTAVTIVLVLVGMVLVGFVLHQNRRLDSISRTDGLTGLANRLGFDADLRKVDGKPAAVVLVDVDHFKTINDTLGHSVGDGVIVELATRLRTAGADADTIARIGGDEFAIVFSGEAAEARSLSCADAVLASMDEPCRVAGTEVQANVTIGIGAQEASQGATLLNDADIALYAAKGEGRGRYRRFRPEMKQAFLREQAIEDALRRAAAAGDFSLVYQPIVDLSDDRTVGFEALLRWQHPELGSISPTEFIPIAERSGQIEAIGRWVIEEACREASRWPSDVYVAVNVSARQLLDQSFIAQSRAALEENGLEPCRLEIEITESTLIVDDATVLELVHQLRALGCRVSLDDFGTGYASLSYLQRFPFDKIKIDQCFLRGEGVGVGGHAIIATVCSLAEVLDLRIVTEGVETPDELATVRRAGSHYGQGYHFDRPLRPDDVLKRIARESLDRVPLVVANVSAA